MMTLSRKYPRCFFPSPLFFVSRQTADTVETPRSPMVDNYQSGSPSNQKGSLMTHSRGSLIGRSPYSSSLIGWLTLTALVKCSAPTQLWLNHSMNNNEQQTAKNFGEWWQNLPYDCSCPQPYVYPHRIENDDSRSLLDSRIVECKG